MLLNISFFSALVLSTDADLGVDIITKGGACCSLGRVISDAVHRIFYFDSVVTQTSNNTCCSNRYQLSLGHYNLGSLHISNS